MREYGVYGKLCFNKKAYKLTKANNECRNSIKDDGSLGDLANATNLKESLESYLNWH